MKTRKVYLMVIFYITIISILEYVPYSDIFSYFNNEYIKLVTSILVSLIITLLASNFLSIIGDTKWYILSNFFKLKKLDSMFISDYEFEIQGYVNGNVIVVDTKTYDMLKNVSGDVKMSMDVKGMYKPYFTTGTIKEQQPITVRIAGNDKSTAKIKLKYCR